MINWLIVQFLLKNEWIVLIFIKCFSLLDYHLIYLLCTWQKIQGIDKTYFICSVNRSNITRGWDVHGEEKGITAAEAVPCQCGYSDRGLLFHGPPADEHERGWGVLRGSRRRLHSAGPNWRGQCSFSSGGYF